MTQKILCAVDFSKPSERALDKARELCLSLGAELELVHAYQNPYLGPPEAQHMAMPSLLMELKGRAERALAHLKDVLTRAGLTVNTELIEGYPSDAIVKRAEQIGASMIVMGTHGRAGFRRFLLGSVAERVVRTASIPVLTVRTEE